MREENLKILITCEHGGNIIPEEYSTTFSGGKEELESHRGYDIGALELFQNFESNIGDFTHFSQTSRLLVELNRSLHHPKLYSEFTQHIAPDVKEKILQEHYFPYRNQVETKIGEWVRDGLKVLHLSVHSFTPVMSGKLRNTDIGLLYDPSRAREQLFAAHWRQQLHKSAPQFKVRYNYPYKGTADGFVTHLRKEFNDEQYAGLELEVNQKFPEQKHEKWEQLKNVLVSSFRQAL
ncbi:N-formylglutamate amidohydrolase [Rufibacter roseus]|uniref:N-formylglutamate amidohydrolase n=1 Tax=Rufibacter roseus TaxID=1567108 RepID=A0ABW2DRF1_9BACT|nr:N-formylglutamate amidohydrolase [Rufibacter roseus]